MAVDDEKEPNVQRCIAAHQFEFGIGPCPNERTVQFITTLVQ